jgi:hypothetical protein
VGQRPGSEKRLYIPLEYFNFKKSAYMAKQVGGHSLRGSIGDVTYYKNAFGFLAKEKSGPSRNMVLKDPRFAPTRQISVDFTAAIYAGQLVRHAFRPLLETVKNVRLSGRMNGVFTKILKLDMAHGRGQRMVSAGSIVMLKGFEFNQEHLLTDKLRVSYKASINAAKGTMQVTMSPFVPKKVIKGSPAGATHFKIESVGAAVDFTKKKFDNSVESTPLLKIDGKLIKPVCLKHTIKGAPGESLLLGVGIVFYKMVDGCEKKIKGGALKVVAVREVEKGGKK